MVDVISKIVAVLLCAVIAIILYPIAGICWVFSQIGKIGEHIFKWANTTIKKIWADIKKNNDSIVESINNENK